MISLRGDIVHPHSLRAATYRINQFNARHQYSLKFNRPLVRGLIPWWNGFNIHTSALFCMEPYVYRCVCGGGGWSICWHSCSPDKMLQANEVYYAVKKLVNSLLSFTNETYSLSTSTLRDHFFRISSHLFV